MNEIKFKKQIGGTCWFHATLNGFLLSYYGRIFLEKVISKYPVLKPAAPDSCPSPNSDRSELLKYVKRYLTEGINVRHNSTLREFTGRSNTHMRSGGLRNLHEKGLIRKLFQPELERSIIYFSDHSVVNGITSKEPFNYEKQEWVLSHAIINVYFIEDNIGHAIAGVRIKGDRYFIVDSGTNESYEYDWRTNADICDIGSMIGKRYKKTTKKVLVTFVYIQEYFIKKIILDEKYGINNLTNFNKYKEIEKPKSQKLNRYENYIKKIKLLKNFVEAEENFRYATVFNNNYNLIKSRFMRLKNEKEYLIRTKGREFSTETTNPSKRVNSPPKAPNTPPRSPPKRPSPSKNYNQIYKNLKIKGIPKNNITKLTNNNKNKLSKIFNSKTGFHNAKNYRLQRALIDPTYNFSNNVNKNISINNIQTRSRKQKHLNEFFYDKNTSVMNKIKKAISKPPSYFGTNTMIGYLIKRRQQKFPEVNINNLKNYNLYNNETILKYIINGTNKVNKNLKNPKLKNQTMRWIAQAYVLQV